MKSLKNVFILFIVLITFNACEEEYQISKTFVDILNSKPISGLSVGLYKSHNWTGTEILRDSSMHIDSVELIATATTDASGRATFNLKDKNVDNLVFIPVPTIDTTKINAKYFFNNTVTDLPVANFDQYDRVALNSLYEVTIRVRPMQKTDYLVYKFENNWYHPGFKDDIQFFKPHLKPGQSYNLVFYKKVDTEFEFIASKHIYVKYQINTSKYLFNNTQIKQQIDIQLLY